MRNNGPGEPPPFLQHGKGIHDLSKWMEQGLTFEKEQNYKEVRQSLHTCFLEMKWEALVEMGLEAIEATSRIGADGIDVRRSYVVGDVIQTRMAIQANKWKQKFKTPNVQLTRGGLGTHEKGLSLHQ